MLLTLEKNNKIYEKICASDLQNLKLNNMHFGI